jgi:hypothetical protein
LGGRGRRISEFEASLIYKVRSRTARAIQRNPVSKKQEGRKEGRKGGRKEGRGDVYLSLLVLLLILGECSDC